MLTIGRRRFLASSSALLAAGSLAGCGTSKGFDINDLFAPTSEQAGNGETISRPDYKAVYDGYQGEEFPVAPFDYRQVDPMFLRQVVRYQGAAHPGSIVVDPKGRFLFFIEPGNRATRYGVATIVRDGAGLRIEEQACRVEMAPALTMTSTISDKVASTTPPLRAPFRVWREGTQLKFARREVAQALGVRLQDPARDPLPREPSDPRV